MSCEYREDYRDFIVQYPTDALKQYLEGQVGCITRVGGEWAIFTGPPLGNLSAAIVGYYSIPKLFTIMDTGSIEKSGIGRVHRQNNLSLTGAGIIIGMVDTGIDIFHEAFRDSAGFTRIGVIMDQTLGDREFFTEEINDYIQRGDRTNAPGRDTNGHGTFVMGVAAGSRVGTDFIGVAYYSEIAVVKLRTAKQYLRDYYFYNQEEVYSETDIMLGIQYLTEYARKKGKPLVIMVGLGCGLGPHSGKTPLEDYLDEVAKNPQTAVCVCAGNEALSGLHYEGIASGRSYDTVEIQVDEGQRGIMLEVWSENSDVLAIGLEAPTGEIIEEIPPRLNTSSNVQFVLNATKVTVDYKLVEVVSGREVIIVRFDSPVAGVWKLRVYRGRMGTRYEMWLGGSIREGTRFVSPSPFITVTSPASAGAVITTGGYNHVDESLYQESGRGFTAENAVKPDIVSPSVEVFGPKAGGGFTRRTGTSVGNAHTAGVCALLFEWGIVRGNIPLMNTFYAKSLIIRGATRKGSIMYPSREWGWGSLEAYRIFELLAGLD